MKWFVSGLALATALLGLNACAKAPEVPTDWKTECVGRYQIAVPGDVEIAVQSRKYLFVERGPSSAGVAFSNKDYVAYSDFYINGMVMVSPPFDLVEYKKYRAMHFEMK